MKRKILFLLASVMLLILTAAGCSKADLESKLLRQSPTPVPVTEAPAETVETVETVEAESGTEMPSPLPDTPTPAPTSTPSPRMIGTKTSQSKYMFLTNTTDNPLREIYLCLYGQLDWGKNLIPPETTVRAGERVQMFFDEPGEKDLYSMKLVDKAGNIWAIYAFPLADMDSATIQIIGGVAFLYYTSLSTGQQTNTMYGERLAKSYDYSTYTASVATTADPHEGDYNYGYYDANGNWVAYEYGDTTYTVYDPDTGTSTTDTTTPGTTTTDTTTSDPIYTASDTGTGEETIPDGETVTYYDDPTDYTQYEGNPDYGYYDDYGNWMSYY